MLPSRMRYPIEDEMARRWPRFRLTRSGGSRIAAAVNFALELARGGGKTSAFPAEDIDMKQANQTALAGLGRNEDGRAAARVVALSTGEPFGLILVLKALSW